MKICLFGAPGSGKSTIMGKLADEFGLTAVGVGHLLRNQGNIRVGKKSLEEILAEGHLAPQKITIKVVRSELEKIGFDNFVIDGFPRNLEQNKKLVEMGGVDLGLFLNVDEDSIRIRLRHRYYCPSCGRSYHKELLPPKKDGLCDRCGTVLEKREDEDKNVLRKRLEIFRKDTMPIVRKYEEDSKLVQIDATKSPGETWKSVKKAVKFWFGEGV